MGSRCNANHRRAVWAPRSTRARVDVIRERNQKLVVVLAMFWNVAFFRKLGFQSVGRDQLPAAVRRSADFQNSKYKHSATLWQSLEIDH